VLDLGLIENLVKREFVSAILTTFSSETARVEHHEPLLIHDLLADRRVQPRNICSGRKSSRHECKENKTLHNHGSQ
jgi:hypothetical protein